MDWTLVAVAAISAVPPTLAVVANMLQNRRNHVALDGKIDSVIKATNGMSDKLSAQSRTIGQGEGRDQERAHPT